MAEYRQVGDSRWRISNGLAESVGLAWIQSDLAKFDWSRCWLTLRRDEWGSRTFTREFLLTYPVSGYCKRVGRKYRLLCRVNTLLGWPAPLPLEVRPLYRSEDGTWPPVPVGYRVVRKNKSKKSGKEWMQLRYRLLLNDEDEAVVAIIAHEAAHYLRLTRQIPITSPNREMDANAFAIAKVEEFRKRREQVTASGALARQKGTRWAT